MYIHVSQAISVTCSGQAAWDVWRTLWALPVVRVMSPSPAP